ncbi:hypothetical protein [Nocardia abscessus]|uniref:hypothetical protein n=1 Tax=Nocardia abscessus TaxID=120957 RepID=UPI002456C5B2|nr:hypothetical protein [Nocardia abscessus]
MGSHLVFGFHSRVQADLCLCDDLHRLGIVGGDRAVAHGAGVGVVLPVPAVGRNGLIAPRAGVGVQSLEQRSGDLALADVGQALGCPLTVGFRALLGAPGVVVDRSGVGDLPGQVRGFSGEFGEGSAVPGGGGELGQSRACGHQFGLDARALF